MKSLIKDELCNVWFPVINNKRKRKQWQSQVIADSLENVKNSFCVIGVLQISIRKQ